MKNDASDSGPPRADSRLMTYDWPAYAALIESLARQVGASYRPDQIIGIARGGLMPAVILSNYLDAPIGVMAAASYEPGSPGFQDVKGSIKIGSNMASVMPQPGRHILLVDDMTDSGDTMAACSAWLRECPGGAVREIRTAVIWHKTGSIFRPDYFAEEVKPGADGRYPWIVQPFEKYEKRPG